MIIDVIKELRKHDELKGQFLWDNPYIVSCPSNTRSQLNPEYACKAFNILAERMRTEPLSSKMFQEKICIPMKIVEVWQALMIKRYGAVAISAVARCTPMAELSQLALNRAALS